MSKFYILLMLLVLHMGCAHHREMQYDYAQVNDDIRVNLSGLYALIPEHCRILQLITYQKEDETERVQVVIKKSQDITINVLSASGIELLSVRVTPRNIEFLNDSELIPRDFLTFVMGHMVLVYADKLREQIPADIAVLDNEGERVLLKNSMAIFEINYKGQRNLRSDISFKSFSNPYSLQIRTLKYEQDLY